MLELTIFHLFQIQSDSTTKKYSDIIHFELNWDILEIIISVIINEKNGVVNLVLTSNNAQNSVFHY